MLVSWVIFIVVVLLILFFLFFIWLIVLCVIFSIFVNVWLDCRLSFFFINFKKLFVCIGFFGVG